MTQYTIKTALGMNTLNRLDISINITGSDSIVLNNSILDSINLNDEYYGVHLNNSMINHEYFTLKSGLEHYRLLTYLSMMFDGINIFDIGTCGGASSLALSSSPNNTVHSFDVRNVRSPSLSSIPNIKFYTENILENRSMCELLLKSPLIFLDTAHDGVFEYQFYKFLVDNNYHGIFGLDDINLNDAMRNFWKNISTRKEEVTRYGHFSGTGLVLFNDITIITK
jgi:hypothetical protein